MSPEAFWNGKRVTVTGGKGFLGSFVVDGLRRRGVEPFLFGSRDYDLVDPAGVARLYDDAQPDVLIHLAARVGGIGANRENPGKFFYDNLTMGVQLMEEGRKRGLSKLVAIGTVCAYPKLTPVPFREDALWDGYPEETNAPYGLAKKMLLVQSEAYRQQYGFNSIFLLPVNLYGPRDHFDPAISHVIPALIKKVDDAQAAGRDEIVCWGDGSPTREFIHAADAAEGILLAAETHDTSLPINLGSGDEVSIAELAHMICEACEFRGRIRWDTSKPNGQPRRCLDTTRAKELLGFEAEKPFREGLAETVAWYRAQRS